MDLRVALYHGEFAATAALMEHYGVPIDMEIFSLLADKKIWREVRDAMVPSRSTLGMASTSATTPATGLSTCSASSPCSRAKALMAGR